MSEDSKSESATENDQEKLSVEPDTESTMELPANSEMLKTSLKETRDSDQNPLLAKVLDQYLDDLQNGRACSRESLIARYPQIEADLNECLEGIDMVAGLGVGSDLAPKQLGDFEIVKPIGRGAMGVVYEAQQISLKRTVALKMLRYSSAGLQASKRFEREAELVATLMHENIVPIYSYGEHESMHYFAMQLIDGPSLAAWNVSENVDRDGVSIAKLGAQVARALAHAHQRDVIHRDVKPSNLLKDADKIWLTDFGLARRFDDVRMSMTGTMLGTPNYMSPEQATPGRYPIDHRTDVYSLGATLFELLTGRCVFLADTPHAVLAQVLTEEAPPLRELVPDASRDLETILIKCLEKEPRDRYATAAELAEDLESFAEGRSIRARRPSLIERAVRWRRQNERAFSWATTAAILAVTLAAISALAWNAWHNANKGKLSLLSDEGPIVGRLIDDNGIASPTFTIPTQNSMNVHAGDYQLQTWTNGRIGNSQKLSIVRGMTLPAKIRMPDLGVFPEQTVKGIPFKIAVRDGDRGRHDFIFLRNDSIGRMDGRNGKELWSTDTALLKKEKSKTQGSFEWSWPDKNSIFMMETPTVLDEFPDINSDGVADVLVACKDAASSFVLDGSDGSVLWHFIAQESGSVDESEGLFRRPQLIDDIDGDELADIVLLTCTPRQVGDFQRKAVALSSKTGKEIWNLKILDSFLENPTGRIPETLLQSPVSRPRTASFYNNQSGFLFRSNTSSPTIAGNMKPWSVVVEREDAGDSQIGWLICGKHLISIDLKTGTLNSEINEGEAIDLGFYPSLQPKEIKLNGVEHLLLTEQSQFADQNSSTGGHARHCLWSTKTQSLVWEYTARADSTWTAREIDWPKIVDITNDGIPEIIVADGADLGESVFGMASCQGSLQALDARTGLPIWNSTTTAKIRNQDRQIHHFTVGPDADGDEFEDLYAVSPMINRSTSLSLSVFIDIISSKSGERIRAVESKLPFVDNISRAVDLNSPFLWGTSPDGSPQIVISVPAAGPENFTAVVSTGDGSVVHSGPKLLLIANNTDGNGDGRDDLFMYRSRDYSKPFETGQLVSIKSSAAEQIRLLGLQYQVEHDMDGDGTEDLITSNFPNLYRVHRAVSGKTGNTIWEYKFPGAQGRLQSLKTDIDGDNVVDFLGVETTVIDREWPPKVSLVSGRTGKEIWRLDAGQEIAMGLAIGTFSTRCEDVDGDGLLDILLLHRSHLVDGNLAPNNSSLRIVLSCIDTTSGRLKWMADLVPDGPPPAYWFGCDLTMWPIHVVKKSNAKGSVIICPGFAINANAEKAPAFIGTDGLDGKEVWKSPFEKVPKYPFKIWRSLTLNLKDESKQQIVRVEPLMVDRTFTVNWIDAATGKQVSTWAGKGAMNHVLDQTDPTREIEFGTPFEIRDKGNIYTGLVIDKHNDTNMETLVFDSSTPIAKLVRRVHLDREYGLSSSGQFKIADVNGDGCVDLIGHDSKKLYALDLVSGEEIRSINLEASHRSLLSVDKHHRLHFFREANDTSKIELIDVRNFQTQWSIPIPSRVTPEAAVKHFGASLVDAESGRVPKFYFPGNGNCVAIASKANYLGDDPNVVKALNSRSDLWSNLSNADPRLVLPPPWKLDVLEEWSENGMLWDWLSRLVVVIGCFAFPILFVRFWMRTNVISLRMFMLLPLLFAVPYAVATQPLDPRLAEGIPGLINYSQWTNVLLHSAMIVPAVVAIASLFLLLFQRRWIWVTVFLTGTMFFAVLVGALITVKEGLFLTPDNCHFDYWDPTTLVLIPYGLSWVGGVLICGAAVRAAWRIGLRLFRRRKPANTVVSGATI
ncbi:MAG: serine/threonine protein kinase [Mariniblastus sp.]